MNCRLIRFRAGLRLDDGRSLPSGVERHLAHCPECAAWHRAQQDLIRQLRRPSAFSAASADPSPFLHAKILRAVDAQQQQPPSRQPSPAVTPSWIWQAGTAVAAAVVIAAIGWTPRQSPSPRQPDAMTRVSPAPLVLEPVAPPVRPAGGNGKRLLTVAENFDQPLRRELALLNADAMAAVHALKSSFLPGGSLPEKN